MLLQLAKGPSQGVGWEKREGHAKAGPKVSTVLASATIACPSWRSGGKGWGGD